MEVAPVPAQKVLTKENLEDSSRPSLIRNLFEEGNNLRKIHGNEVLDFSLGNPAIPPPKEFQEALANIAANPPADLHSYMSNIGRPQTRAVMAQELSKWYNIPLKADHFVLTCGAAAAINILFRSIIPADSEIIIIAPFFAEYLRYIENVHSKAVIVKSTPTFDLDVDAIEKAITPKTRAIIINSPNNPSGKIYSEATLVRLGTMLMHVYQQRLATDPNASPVFVVSDEPYRRISYSENKSTRGDNLPSVMNCYAYSFIVSSFSKDLSLPGERIGWIVMHPCLYSPQLQASFATATRVLGFVNAPSLMQFAIERALPTADITGAISFYKERRDILYKGIIDAGLECNLPEGAFYLFPRVPAGMTDFRFSEILKKHLVLAVPGSAFGDAGCVRFAYCVTLDTVTRAVPRIKAAVEEAKAELAAQK